MTGGGWTLILKADGRELTFSYDSHYWTNKQLYNKDSTDMSINEHKNEGFYSISTKEIKILFNNYENPCFNESDESDYIGILIIIIVCVILLLIIITTIICCRVRKRNKLKITQHV